MPTVDSSGINPRFTLPLVGYRAPGTCAFAGYFPDPGMDLPSAGSYSPMLTCTVAPWDPLPILGTTLQPLRTYLFWKDWGRRRQRRHPASWPMA